jgi:hypothetical protein
MSYISHFGINSITYFHRLILKHTAPWNFPTLLSYFCWVTNPWLMPVTSASRVTVAIYAAENFMAGLRADGLLTDLTVGSPSFNNNIVAGMTLIGDAGTPSDFTVVDSTFNGNWNSAGGYGIFSVNARGTVSTSTMNNNIRTDGGGLVNSGTGVWTLVDVEAVRNQNYGLFVDDEDDAITTTTTTTTTTGCNAIPIRRRTWGTTLLCWLSIAEDGIFVLMPHTSTNQTGGGQGQEGEEDVNLLLPQQDNNNNNNNKISWCPCEGNGNCYPIPHCVTDRYYDQISLQSYPRSQQLLHVSQLDTVKWIQHESCSLRQQGGEETTTTTWMRPCQYALQILASSIFFCRDCTNVLEKREQAATENFFQRRQQQQQQKQSWKCCLTQQRQWHSFLTTGFMVTVLHQPQVPTVTKAANLWSIPKEERGFDYTVCMICSPTSQEKVWSFLFGWITLPMIYYCCCSLIGWWQRRQVAFSVVVVVGGGVGGRWGWSWWLWEFVVLVQRDRLTSILGSMC